MSTSDPIAVVQTFIAAINRHDMAGIEGRMTEDHLFTDAVGSAVRGREAMRGAWEGFFDAFPDYEIDVEEMTRHGEKVGAFGTARGTYRGGKKVGDAFRIPAAWMAIVRGEQVAEWRVYCDTAAMQRILEAHRGE